MKLSSRSVVSALSLALACSAGAGEAPPLPPVVAVDALPDPFWWPTHIFADDPVPLAFSVDLDLIAPLGAKPGNGAVWFADFAKNIGSRRDEVEKAQASSRSTSFGGTERRVLPPDHPLLLEAEPWVDCATWSFYPEVWPWQGDPTPIADLLFALQLGRSWVARGQASEDPALAVADHRRTIRFGRLLLQDDVVFVQNLVGIALVRTGAEAIFDDARKRGDGAAAALAALVLQDCTALRLELTRRFQRIGLFPDFVARIEAGEGVTRTELRLPDARFSQVLDAARAEPCRAIRIEAMVPLWITSRLGTTDQRTQAAAALAELAKDRDGIVAAAAAEVMARPFSPDQLEAHWTEELTE